MEWNMFNPNDSDTFPPANRILLLALRNGGGEEIISGIYRKPEGCTVGRFCVPNLTPGCIGIPEETVVAWIQILVEFPKI